MKHPVPAAALQQHIGVVGKTGSGKSYAVRSLVERLLEEKRRVCILDPTGAWFGLKSSADGQHAGYSVAVFGGERADVPLTENMGGALADLIASQNLPAVIDLSDFGIGERNRFAAAFAEHLLKKNRLPLHLIIDEADEFMPQGAREKDVQANMMLSRFDRIIRRGRRLGFRCVLITQRPAVLHKNALTQCGTLIAMRLPAPQDRAAVSAWIKGQADENQGNTVLASLASLGRGEGWVWFPEGGLLERARFPKITTFDSMATPEDGGAAMEPAKLASIDLSGINKALEQQLRQAAENDPDELRAQNDELRMLIEDLETKLAQGATPIADPIVDQAAVDSADAAGYHRGLLDGFEKGYGTATSTLGASIDAVVHAANELQERIRETAAVLQRTPDRPDLPPAPPIRLNGGSRPEHHIPAPPSPRSPARAPHTEGAGGLSKAERLILTALAQHPQGRAKNQVAVLTCYASNGGGFNNALSSLRSRGLIDGGSDRLTITRAGSTALGPFKPLPRGRALLEHWLPQLSKAERKALEELASVYPRSLSKAQLAIRSGYDANGGGFNNALSRLRTLELVKGRGELKASEDLF